MSLQVKNMYKCLSEYLLFSKKLLSIYYEIVNCIKSNNFDVITYGLSTCLQRNGDDEPSHEKPGYKNRQSHHYLRRNTRIETY